MKINGGSISRQNLKVDEDFRKRCTDQKVHEVLNANVIE